MTSARQAGRSRLGGSRRFALRVDRAAICRALFQQAAVYVWEPAALHLIACAGDRHDILGYLATSGTTLRPRTLR